MGKPQSLYHGFAGVHTCIERQTGKTHYRSTHITNVHKRTYTQTRTQEQLAGGGGGQLIFGRNFF